jgi:two-component sensor histidine kinase
MLKEHDILAVLQQQKASIASFGLEALKSPNLDELLTKAAELAAFGLSVKRAKVLELVDPATLLIRAGVGWDPNVVGVARLPADVGSPAGYALQTGQPVVSNDLMHDSRFGLSDDILIRHRIKSAVNVVIGNDNNRFGVLEVDSDEPREFTTNDVNFLQGYANLLSAAIERLRMHMQLEEALRERTKAVEYKETLLAELQHQVRNNLQVIVSMINLQREKQAADMEVVSSQIQALRGIYDKLYLVDHHGEVDFGGYLLELSSNLVQFQSAIRKTIHLDAKCEHLHVTLNKAVPLGLVCNEFIMNSIKHAFPNNKGRLTIRLAAIDATHGHLMIADDGIGFDHSTENTGGRRGLSVMQRLAVQADTEIVWESVAVGTRMTMTINCIPRQEND